MLQHRCHGVGRIGAVLLLVARARGRLPGSNSGDWEDLGRGAAERGLLMFVMRCVVEKIVHQNALVRGNG